MLRDTRDSISQRIREAGPGSMYRCVRSVISGGNCTGPKMPDMDVETLNLYFSEIGTRTAALVNATRSNAAFRDELPVRLPRVVSDTFSVQPVSIDDLYATVTSLNSSNACDTDGLTMSFLKKCFDAVSHVILCLVNTSLVTGTVPKSWKLSVIQPIYKGSGVLTDPSNFRPISLVPCLAKIIERIVHGQLNAYFSTHHLFSDTQFGFRRNHSTETALIQVTDSILNGMDNGKISLLVLLDLSKCFDVVDHTKLLRKLEHYGIEIKWFKSYLSDHFQYVRLNSDRTEGGSGNQRRNIPGQKCSTSVHNPIGVYQGTCLGPLLYTIFSNDLSLYISPKIEVFQYADDTQLLITGKKHEIQDMIRLMEDALSTLYQWFTQNSMKLNSSKSQLLVLGTRQMLSSLPTISLSVHGNIITESSRVKNVGVIMDRTLSFEPHIDALVGRCTGMLLGLHHARHRLPPQIIKPIVNSLVLSSVRYCLSVYGNCNAQSMHRIQKIINFCARVVTGRRKRDHISDAVRLLGWLPAREMIVCHSLCLLRRVMDVGEPALIANQLATRSERQERATRNDSDLFLPRIRTESGRRRFIYRASHAFNELPHVLRHKPIGAFKRELKRHLS